MTSIDAKICGLKTAGTVDAAVSNGARWIGFILFPKSPRHLDPGEIAPLAARKGAAQSVAVTVNASDDLLGEIQSAFAPDIIQLHGSEPPDRVTEARRFAPEVWKAVPVAEEADLAAAKAYDGIADRILFDAKPPKGADRPGGWGESYDYALLKKLDLNTPWLLSGGLDATNVLSAVEKSGASAVDVSSGVESAPGVKDTARIAAFLAALKSQ